MTETVATRAAAGPADEQAAGVVLVPHTHWDREWYEPFQRFRLRLVRLLDAVLDQAEREPGFRFTLDGQMAAVNDYLEIRPEHTERIRAAVARGQLAIGPWQILPDEFLCSGENLVRNLESGIRNARALGGFMPVGYLPDMFGHAAQMPQLLSRAGFRFACVWRGVPQRVTEHAFRWEAPDGSAVTVEYLPTGYSNAAYLFDGGRLEAQLRDFVDRERHWFGSAELLGMYGTDHMVPVTNLVEVVSEQRSGHHVRVATLAEYVTSQPYDEKALTTVRGELRSHARANILPGILSVRSHLKLALRRAERTVERYAEPLAALYTRNWPQQYLDLAWDRLIASACHDSVTGCGVDDTALQVAARIAEAEHAGQAVRDTAVGDIAATLPAGHLLVVNPSPFARWGWIECDALVPDGEADVLFELPDGQRVLAQALSRTAALLGERVLAAHALPTIFASIHGHELFGQIVVDAQVDTTAHEVTFVVGPEHVGPPFDLLPLRRQLEAAAGGDAAWTVRIRQRDRLRVGAMVPAPPLGWTAVRPVPVPASAPDTSVPVAAPVVSTGSGLDNGLLRVDVDADGTVRLRSAGGVDLSDVARLVDGGDRGDTYNYAPPATDEVVDRPERVEIEVLESGPLRGVIALRRMYAWPHHVDWAADRRSAARAENATVTRLELRSGEPFLRMQIEIDNRCLDHRLRLHLVLPRAAEVSAAEGQFAVAERGREAEGGCGETPIATFPASAFVDAGGATLLLDRPSEYELVDEGRALALTLLRPVGQLSRNVHPYREEPAGPQLPTPDAQCVGVATTSLAVLPHGRTWSTGGVLDAAEQWGHDFVSTWTSGTAQGSTGLTCPGLEIGGDGSVLTSLRRRGDWLELRLVRAHPEPGPATIRGQIAAARRCDLLGAPLEGELTVADGAVTLPLRPWEIVTVQLRRDGTGE